MQNARTLLRFLTKIPKTVPNSNGFTLIELLIVFSVAGILSTVGIASFYDYNRVQTLNTSASEVVTLLNTAKSRAASQVKPTECVGTLDSYIVELAPQTRMNQYDLKVRCGNTDTVLDTKTLPSGVTFENSNVFSFKILSGNVLGASQNGTTVTLTNSTGQEKSINVYSDGRINILVE